MSKTYLVAIAGGTCSGKSTLSEELERRLKEKTDLQVLHMDSYFKRPTPDTVAPITGKTYPEHNHPDSLKLDEMRTDLEKALEEKRLVIVEGLFALYLPWIREQADLKVYVDLKSDERLARRIVKHMKWGQTYEQVVDRYLDTVRFRHDELIEPTRWHADLVINGIPNKGADVIERWILSEL